MFLTRMLYLVSILLHPPGVHLVFVGRIRDSFLGKRTVSALKSRLRVKLVSLVSNFLEL